VDRRRRLWIALLLALGSFGFLLRPYPREKLDGSALGSTRIADREGRLLYEARSEAGGYGRWVPLDRISPHLVLLTLSAEDAGFRAHPGVDPVGVMRALWLNARAGRRAYGGSTITQQLAKNLDPEPRTLLGKIFEASDALRLELTLSKDEILEQYLNRAYYGRLAYGAEAAAQRWFGKSAAELRLDEAALLASLPRGPTAYDPERHPERAWQRRAHVLAKAAERGWIEPEAADKAASAPIRVIDPAQRPAARHLLDALGRTKGGEVMTTIDLELQNGIEQRLRAHLAELSSREVDQAAVVVLDNRTGEVLALVGSRSYTEASENGAVNAALSRRPPGSTLKPFVYALAIEQGKHPSSPVLDVPTSWPGFLPRNARLEHAGLVSLREALASSLNVPAVREADALGIERVSSLLGELELTAEQPARAELALALGSSPVRLIDLAAAYATLARGGEHLPYRLTKPGAPPASSPRRLLSAESAFLVTDVLADARARRREFGLETPLELPFPAAVKTGTSKSFCDNWAVGYTPEITVAVWAGNFDGRPMHGMYAIRGAAPLWREVMLLAMEGRARRDFEPPTGVERALVCSLSGMRPGPGCPHAKSELVASRHAPAESCTWHAPHGKLRIPAELAAFARPGASDVLPDASAPLAILAPHDGARLKLDPLLPRERQQLRLRAAVALPGAAGVRWEVDGRPIAEASAPYFTDWPLEPGEHRVRATLLDAAGNSRAIREISISVQAGGKT
jgi:penicillin-binding protein 1C